MSPHSETRTVGSPWAQSTGRVFSERDEYWSTHSVLSRTYLRARARARVCVCVADSQPSVIIC